MRKAVARELLPLDVLARPFDEGGRQRHGNGDSAVVVGNDDLARHDQHVAAGDRHIDGEGNDTGLRVKVRRASTTTMSPACAG